MWARSGTTFHTEPGSSTCPMEMTQFSMELTSRVGSMWMAVISSAMAGTGSTAFSGMAPWPPLPVSMMSYSSLEAVASCRAIWIFPAGTTGCT